MNHAYELHPEAIGSLKNIQDESMRDVTHPWTLKEEEKLQVKYFMIFMYLLLTLFRMGGHI